MTVKEIAELCGVDKTTVYRWVEHDNFLSCKMQLRKSILEQIQNGSPEVPADFSLEETLAIIRDGGKMRRWRHCLKKRKIWKRHCKARLNQAFCRSVLTVLPLER